MCVCVCVCVRMCVCVCVYNDFSFLNGNTKSVQKFDKTYNMQINTIYFMCWNPLCGQSHGILGQFNQINYVFQGFLNQSNLTRTQHKG